MRRNLNVIAPVNAGVVAPTSNNAFAVQSRHNAGPIATVATTINSTNNNSITNHNHNHLSISLTSEADALSSSKDPTNAAISLLKWRITTTSAPWVICYCTPSDQMTHIFESLGLCEDHVLSESSSFVGNLSERISRAEELLQAGSRLVALQMVPLRVPTFQTVGLRPRLAAILADASMAVNLQHFDFVMDLA